MSLKQSSEIPQTTTTSTDSSNTNTTTTTKPKSKKKKSSTSSSSSGFSISKYLPGLPNGFFEQLQLSISSMFTKEFALKSVLRIITIGQNAALFAGRGVLVLGMVSVVITVPVMRAYQYSDPLPFKVSRNVIGVEDWYSAPLIPDNDLPDPNSDDPANLDWAPIPEIPSLGDRFRRLMGMETSLSPAYWSKLESEMEKQQASKPNAELPDLNRLSDQQDQLP